MKKIIFIVDNYPAHSNDGMLYHNENLQVTVFSMNNKTEVA